MEVDTRQVLKERLGADLAMPPGELADQVLEAAVSMAASYQADVPAIVEKYADLFCSWCGRLHRSSECEQKTEELKQRAQGAEAR